MVVKIPKKLEMKSLLPAPCSPLPTPHSRISFSPPNLLRRDIESEGSQLPHGVYVPLPILEYDPSQ
jgi:hypothetical protein